MKVIKFTLKSSFAFFKNKEHISVNHSYPTIPKTYIIGALAGVIGLNGFHTYSKDYKKINNLILEIEKNLNKINIDDLENKLMISVDNEIENLIVNKNKFLKKLNDLNETIDYIGNVKSIKDIVKNIKDKEEQIILLSNFRTNNFQKIDNLKLKDNISKNIDNLNNAKVELLTLNETLIELKNKMKSLNIEYGILFNNKVSIVTKKDINIIETTFNDSTLLGITNKVGSASQQVEHILNDVEYDIYYELKDNENDNKIKDFLLNDKRIYDFYLGKNQFIADISNVEILELQQLKEIEFNDSLNVISICDNKLIDECNLNIKINMPIESTHNGIYSKYKLLTIYEDQINKYDSNLYKLENNKLLYFI